MVGATVPAACRDAGGRRGRPSPPPDPSAPARHTPGPARRAGRARRRIALANRCANSSTAFHAFCSTSHSSNSASDSGSSCSRSTSRRMAAIASSVLPSFFSRAIWKRIKPATISGLVSPGARCSSCRFVVDQLGSTRPSTASGLGGQAASRPTARRRRAACSRPASCGPFRSRRRWGGVSAVLLLQQRHAPPSSRAATTSRTAPAGTARRCPCRRADRPAACIFASPRSSASSIS